MRLQVGGLPLVDEIMRRMRLRQILGDTIPASERGSIPAVDAVLLLVMNMAVAKDPLYELQQWVESVDLRCLGYARLPGVKFSDDRFTRALDKLYQADRASLMTSVVVSAVRTFKIDLSRIHNDCTTVSTFGRIAGRTRSGLEMLRGYSKGHRPDLKQLVFCLSICEDGAVPVHHKAYPGNRNEDATHIETWETLRQIHGRPDFIYVGDCKLCGQKQLAHIVSGGGRAITILPEGRLEARQFKDGIRVAGIKKKLLWRRPKPCDESTTEYFYLYEGQHRTRVDSYPLWWYSSSEKRERDRYSREDRLRRAGVSLAALNLKINKGRLEKKGRIERAATGILTQLDVRHLMRVDVRTHIERMRLRRRGRPGIHSQYRTACRVSYSLHWSPDQDALRREARTDGLFPLVCTDPMVSPRDVLKIYKYQPRLEKRFSQFKSIHRAAPLLFKRIDRVEANMFVFFLALLVQALIERLVCHRIKAQKLDPLKLYPEERDAPHPTTSRILKTFEGISTYRITQNSHTLEEYRDQLNHTQRQVLKLMDITEEKFWKF
ncbi:MAG: IS1634 family transposase [Candidatus Aureabacteria bacterium]|nr:IS1634 family transposase [Candidatus Auribacterota bacterium]